MEFNQQYDQTKTYTVSATDAAGNPCPVPAGVVWADASGLENLVPSADGLSCTATPTGKLGDAALTVTAGGLSATATIHITAGVATTLVINQQ